MLMRARTGPLQAAFTVGILITALSIALPADARGGRGGGGGGMRGGGGARAGGGGFSGGGRSAPTSINRPSGGGSFGGGDRGGARAGGGDRNIGGGNRTGGDRSIGGGDRTGGDRSIGGGDRTSGGNGNRINTGDVNVNRNVQVNGNGGYYGGGYRHPVAGAIAVGAVVGVTAAAIGSMYATLPPACAPYYTSYYYCGVYYQPTYQGDDVTYVVVDKPD